MSVHTNSSGLKSMTIRGILMRRKGEKEREIKKKKKTEVMKWREEVKRKRGGKKEG